MESLLLALIPLAILIVAHFMWPNEVTIRELIIGAGVSLLIGFTLFALGKSITMSATELWNGSITGTSKSVVYYHTEWESCDSDGKNCTKYVDEGHHMKWYADSDIGPILIQYKDCSSTIKSSCINRYPDPVRWTSIQRGDPVSITHQYTNYIQAAEYGLFARNSNADESQYTPLEYPIEIYDHYRVDRVLVDGVYLTQDVSVWNMRLSEILSTLGPEKQANMILVLTGAGDPTYAEMLLNDWRGANKNDIVIIAGFPTGVASDGAGWIKIHSWAKSDYFNITLRDELLDNPELWSSPDLFFPEVKSIVMDHFERRPMAEFEYLKNEIKPSATLMIIMAIAATILGVIMASVFVRMEPFEFHRR